jgi:signal transduction histidine kinase
MAKQKINPAAYMPEGPLLVSTNAKILLTILSGLVIGLLTVFIVQQSYVASITERVETISALLDTDHIASLKAQDADSAKSRVILRNQLEAARRANDDIRYLYLITVDKTNEVRFLADAGDTANPHFNETIPNASETLKAGFFTHEVFQETSFRDTSGTWISWFAPIYDSTGQPIALLGLDVPRSSYYNVLALAATVPLLATFLIALVFAMTDNARRKRQESVRLRSELVSIASHELRTPLTGIRWGEESLLDSKLTEKNHSILRSMYDSTVRLQESIEDILQLANWQAGRNQELIRTTIDISEMLTGIFATQKLPAAQKDVTLEFAKGWPHKLLISCDAQRMKRVFNNLISNAIKYSQPGTSVVVNHQKIEGKHLITITDRGIGIPKDEQTKVFGGFYRASNAIRQEASGTGMGLYMSRGAVEQHGGKLWLTSEEGKGTTVYIQLP